MIIIFATIIDLKLSKKDYKQNKHHLYGARCKKTCFLWFANNKGADQPVHLRSLISAFVICILESIISRLATSEMSIF